MPEPAAIATWWRAAAGSVGHTKDPSGVVTCTVSPTRTVSFSQLDIRPPSPRDAAPDQPGPLPPGPGDPVGAAGVLALDRGAQGEVLPRREHALVGEVLR